jgi:hypothetical protein
MKKDIFFKLSVLLFAIVVFIRIQTASSIRKQTITLIKKEIKIRRTMDSLSLEIDKEIVKRLKIKNQEYAK